MFLTWVVSVVDDMPPDRETEFYESQARPGRRSDTHDLLDLLTSRSHLVDLSTNQESTRIDRIS